MLHHLSLLGQDTLSIDLYLLTCFSLSLSLSIRLRRKSTLGKDSSVADHAFIRSMLPSMVASLLHHLRPTPVKLISFHMLNRSSFVILPPPFLHHSACKFAYKTQSQCTLLSYGKHANHTLLLLRTALSLPFRVSPSQARDLGEKRVHVNSVGRASVHGCKLADNECTVTRVYLTNEQECEMCCEHDTFDSHH
jgi:hypothetical protein